MPDAQDITLSAGTRDLVLSGIDASNPAGWFAALGALRLAAEAGLEPRLRWTRNKPYTPVITIAKPEIGEGMFALLLLAQARIHGNRFVDLLDRSGIGLFEQNPKTKEKAQEQRRGISALFREVALSATPTDRLAADMAAGLFSDAATGVPSTGIIIEASSREKLANAMRMLMQMAAIMENDAPRRRGKSKTRPEAVIDAQKEQA